MEKKQDNGKYEYWQYDKTTVCDNKKLQSKIISW